MSNVSTSMGLYPIFRNKPTSTAKMFAFCDLTWTNGPATSLQWIGSWHRRSWSWSGFHQRGPATSPLCSGILCTCGGFLKYGYFKPLVFGKNQVWMIWGIPHVGKPRCSMQLPAIFGPGYHQGSTRVSHQEQIAEYLMEMQQRSWPIRPFWFSSQPDSSKQLVTTRKPPKFGNHSTSLY